jgi:glycosyltransferase involved in cell wall biosynthesis
MLNFSPSGIERDEVDAETGIRNVVLPEPRSPFGPGRARSLLKDLSADIVHFHSTSGRYPAIARAAGRPYVVTPHGALMGTIRKPSRLRTLAFRLFIARPFLSEAAVVQAITAGESAGLEHYVARGKIVVVPNALEPATPVGDEEREEARRSLGLHGKDTVVLYLGRLDAEGKGLDLLVEGARRVLVDDPGRRLRLLLVGPRWPWSPMEPLLDEGLAGLVSVHPPVFGADKRAFLAAADAFAIPSRADCLPTAALEALAVGLPLIVSEETGFVDFVRRNQAGAVVSLSADAVASALRSFRPEAYSPRREAIRRAAMAEFDGYQIASRLVTLYEEAAALRPIPDTLLHT